MEQVKNTFPTQKTTPINLGADMTAIPTKQLPDSDNAQNQLPQPTNPLSLFHLQQPKAPKNPLQRFQFEQPKTAKPPQPFKGMPSILDDEQNPVDPPFSKKKVRDVPDNFDEMHANWLKNRTPETNTEILNAIQPVIDTAIQSYVGPNANQTARTQAKMMALRALETYDPRKGNVRTHLLSQLQSLRRFAAQQQNIIDIPEQFSLDHQALQEASNELRDKLGREPTDDELADHTGLSKRRIKKIRSFNQPVSEGMTHNETQEDGSDGSVASNVPGKDPGLDAWLDFVYDDLSSTDKLIMDMTLGRNGRKKSSVQEIAKELGISPSAVSQRAAKIQEMIDRRHEYDTI